MWAQRLKQISLKKELLQEQQLEISSNLTNEQILQEAILYKKIQKLKADLMKGISEFFAYMCKDLVTGIFDNEKTRSRIMELVHETENKISKIREKGPVWKILKIKIDDSIFIEDEASWFLSYSPGTEKNFILNPYMDCERKVYFLVRKLKFTNSQELNDLCNKYVKKYIQYLIRTYFYYKKKFRPNENFDLYLKDKDLSVKREKENLTGRNPNVSRQIEKIIYRDFIDGYCKSLFIGHYDIGLHLMELEKDELKVVNSKYNTSYNTAINNVDRYGVSRDRNIVNIKIPPTLLITHNRLFVDFQFKVDSIYIEVDLKRESNPLNV